MNATFRENILRTESLISHVVQTDKNGNAAYQYSTTQKNGPDHSYSNTDCPLCGSSEGKRMLFELTRPIVKCATCRLVYAVSRGGRTEYQDYGESYYRRGIYADYLADRAAIHKNAKRILGQLDRLVSGRTLLDVGCAAGFFLEAAQAQGWSVRGFEVSRYASEYARQELDLDVDLTSIEAVTKESARFDVVTLWDTIEHLERPDVALRNIRRLLQPEGVLVLSTGDYGSLLRRITGRRWRLFADPTHNFFFDEHALKRLLSQTGYKLIGISRRGKWVSLSMILHQFPLAFTARLRDWFLEKEFNPSLYVSLRDVMTVVARPVG